MRELFSQEIVEHSQVGEVRRIIGALSRALGFTEIQSAKLATAVSEAATNILKHGMGGEILVRSLNFSGVPGIEILALDKGPGIENLRKAMEDGFSTTGSLGVGLGAIKRSAEIFDIYSLPDKGTALLFRVYSKNVPRNNIKPRYFAIGAVSIPKHGEEIYGDGWGVEQDMNRAIFIIVDGLGHGGTAATVSQEALYLFRKHMNKKPSGIIKILHEKLKHTVGCAAGITEVSIKEKALSFCGIGNTSARVVMLNDFKSFISHNGIVGYRISKITDYTQPLPVDEKPWALVLYTDGLSSNWNIDSYPGLLTKHPSLIAGILYRDYGRKNDDVTIVVAKPIKFTSKNYKETLY